jgi:hypothetical protein
VIAALAMPFFPEGRTPDLRGALAWASRFPGMPDLGDIETDGAVATVQIPGGFIGLAIVGRPIPAEEMALITQLAWHWPTARDVVAAHRSHVVCHASSRVLDAVQLHLVHSRIVAGFVATGASGVCIGGSRLLREASAYLADIEAATPKSLPMLSWIGFHAVQDGDMRSAYTAGLAEFGLLELEVRDTRLDWQAVIGLMGDIAHYEMVSGIQIRDGETVGVTEADRKRVRHLDSTYFPGTKSAVIEA